MATAKMKGSTFPRYEQNRFFPFPVSKESSLVASWARASVALGRTLGSEREEKKQIAWSRIVFVLEGEREIYFSTKKRTKLFFSRRGVHPSFIFFLLVRKCVLLLAKEGLCFVFKQTTHLLRFCFIIHKTTQNTGYHRSTTSTVSRPYRTSNNRTSFSTTGRRTRITCSSTRWRNSRVRCPCPSTRTR